MLDTPCVSTPRRSVIVNASAASAASSPLTPSRSKICVTVRRNAASLTSTWSFVGTLKRSRIMARSSGRSERVDGRDERRGSAEQVRDLHGLLDLGFRRAGGAGAVGDGGDAVGMRQ